MSYVKYPSEDIRSVVEDNFNNEKHIALYQKTRDKELKKRIIINNMPLVLKISNDYMFPSKMPLGDLIASGTIALSKAIEMYNTKGEVLFSTYATNSIINEIASDSNEWYGEGRKYYGEEIKIYRSIAISIFGEEDIFKEDIVDYVLNIMLENDLIRPGTIPEVKSRLLSISLYEIDESNDTEEVELKVIDEALEVPYDDESDFDRVLFIKKYKDRLYSGLTDYEKEVMDYYCGYKDGIPHTQKEIGEILGVTHQAIQQQFKKATTKMKNKAIHLL